MAMRLSSAGTRRSSQSSSTSLRFLNNTSTKSRHMMEEDSVSENSHPSLQLNIPHMNHHHHQNHNQNQTTSMSSSFPQKQSRRRRSSSPATISTSAKRMVQTPLQDDEAAMLQYLNREQQRQRKNANMPETWSVKLPAYHHSMQQQQQPTAATTNIKSKSSRKSYPPPNSMFRGNASGVSPAVLNAVVNAVEDEEWLAERREPFATIDESNQKPKWKKWFLN